MFKWFKCLHLIYLIECQWCQIPLMYWSYCLGCRSIWATLACQDSFVPASHSWPRMPRWCLSTLAHRAVGTSCWSLMKPYTILPGPWCCLNALLYHFDSNIFNIFKYLIYLIFSRCSIGTMDIWICWWILLEFTWSQYFSWVLFFSRHDAFPPVQMQRYLPDGPHFVGGADSQALVSAENVDPGSLKKENLAQDTVSYLMCHASI